MTWKNSPWAEIAPACWIATAEPGNTTIGLVAGTREALLIDAGTYPEQARDLCRSAEERSGVPVRHVVITHHHAAHWFGLSGLAALTSYGQESLADQYRDDAIEGEAKRLGLTPSDIVAPQRLFTQAEVVDLGDRFVEMLHTGPAHTTGDVWINVADARVLFAGDLVSIENDPCFGADTDINGWAKTLDLLVQNTRPDAVIVPGHGHPTTQEAV
ncbi:MAG: MBL fold metallo-hydrolase, partial [Propionibacteriaceae bacterium]